MLCVMVKQLKMSDTDASILLVDPSGEACYLHLFLICVDSLRNAVTLHLVPMKCEPCCIVTMVSCRRNERDVAPTRF